MSLDLSGVATSLLKSLASDSHVKIKRVTGQNKNPVTGIISGGTEEFTFLTAAVIDEPIRLNDETRIETGDKIVLMDNKFIPLMSDIVIIPNAFGLDVEYRMVDIGGLNHAGIQQFFQVICRG